LRAWTVASARPKKSVNAVAIVVEIHYEKGCGIDGVDIATNLMVVRVEFSDKFSLIGTILVVLAVDC
jgi:hypothetical protein